VPGEIIGFDLGALPRRDAGFVYRHEIVNHIRGPGTIEATRGAARDRRLQVVAGG